MGMLPSQAFHNQSFSPAETLERLMMALPRFCVCMTSALLLASFSALAADNVDQIISEGEQRVVEGAKAQKQIDELANQADDLLSEYKTITKIIDGLKIYNGLLEKQVSNQVAELDALTESIEKVSLIERQVVPLMVRMIDSLEQFIQLDVPFLAEERAQRVDRLREMMVRSDVTAAEKFRRVIEAYQIENEYGRTIEAYKGKLTVEGKPREVDFLRIGRIALLYYTVGGEHVGAWDKTSNKWQPLPAQRYKQQINRGLRIARKQIAPNLLVLPVTVEAEQ